MQILEIMTKEGAVTVSSLASALKRSQPLMSHEMKVLNEAGLITSSKEGRFVQYSLKEGVAKQSDTGWVFDLGFCEFRLKNVLDKGLKKPNSFKEKIDKKKEKSKKKSKK
jgi:DNA-binding transcriptional ArsR family regulator